MKKNKLRILGIITALLLVGLCVYLAKATPFVYNDEHADGNSAGNLFNKGLFCEYDGQIYFSHLKDDGALYVMNSDFSKVKKLSNDKVAYINVAGEHIIYSRINNKKTTLSQSGMQRNSVGIYRCELDGSNAAALDTSAQGMVHQYGNQIYYQGYHDDSAFDFNTMDILGNDKKRMMEDPIAPGSIVNSTLYYAGFSKDLALRSINLDTMESTLLLKGRYYNVTVNGNYLYMMDVSNQYSIIRTDLDGKNKTTIVSARSCTFNLTSDGQYLYYQVDNNTSNGIHRINLETGKDELLLSGNYSNINITKDYVFFTDFTETTMYAVKIGEKEEVFQFTPPVKE